MVIIGNCGGNDSGPHAVLTADDIDYTYDDVGNMVTATDVSANTTTYSYDDQNHLTGVDFPTGDDLSMVYDADGMRVSRTEGDTTITYVGGLFEVEDDGVTTTLRTHYTFGGDHIAVRVDDEATDTLTYQFTDHLGSIATTYQAGTAGTTNRYLHYYYPYGEPRGTQTVFPSDHTYTGQIDDPGALMYYQARYYQPAIGRFTQADTIISDPGSSQDYNRYGYVRGNPVNANDPTGHTFNFSGGNNESHLPKYRPKPGEMITITESEWDTAKDEVGGDLDLLLSGGVVYEIRQGTVVIFNDSDHDIANDAYCEYAGCLSLADALANVGGGIVDGLVFAWEHREQIVWIGSGIACVVGTAFVCGVAVGIKAGVHFGDNVSEHGLWAGETWIDLAVDVVLGKAAVENPLEGISVGALARIAEAIPEPVEKAIFMFIFRPLIDPFPDSG